MNYIHTMTKGALRLGTLVAVVATLSVIAKADPVVLGQVDTFQSGPQGWLIGFGAGPVPTTPLPVVGGGQGGPGDNYLRISGTGVREPFGSVSAINDTRWTGNYLAAGVNAITMDVINFGPSNLALRLIVAGPFGLTGPPGNIAFTTNAIFLPAGSGWTSVTFLIGPEHLTAQRGTVVGALTNAGALRLYHNPEPGFGGQNNGPPPVNATLGVDNITATAVPEPAAMILLATGLAGVGAAARKRRKARNTEEA
jgi:hypothetical protein